MGLLYGDHLIRYSHSRVSNYTVQSESTNDLFSELPNLITEINRLSETLSVLGPSAEGQAMAARANLLRQYITPFDGAQTYDSLGFSSRVGNFGVSGEWALLNADAIMIGKVHGYQLSVTYQAGNFTPYISISSARRVSSGADSHPITPTGLAQLEDIDGFFSLLGQNLTQISKALDVTTQGLSLGVRWDLGNNIAAKLQFDHLSTPDALTPGAFKVRRFPFDNAVQLLSASVDVIF
jgi:hypothetical protein